VAFSPEVDILIPKKGNSSQLKLTHYCSKCLSPLTKAPIRQIKLFYKLIVYVLLYFISLIVKLQ